MLSMRNERTALLQIAARMRHRVGLKPKPSD